MKLTDHERLLIAQRAHGSYTVIPQLRRIVSAHQKNRNPEDAPFLEFARLTLKTSYVWDDYERLGRAVLAIIPEPHGAPFWKLPKSDPVEPAVENKVRAPKQKRSRKCGICSERGHNARTCNNKPDTPTVMYTDGIERLSPGFDPNPPSKIEEEKKST